MLDFFTSFSIVTREFSKNESEKSNEEIERDLKNRKKGNKNNIKDLISTKFFFPSSKEKGDRKGKNKISIDRCFIDRSPIETRGGKLVKNRRRGNGNRKTKKNLSTNNFIDGESRLKEEKEKSI